MPRKRLRRVTIASLQVMARFFARREERRSFGRRDDLRMKYHSERSEESAFGCGQEVAL